MRIPFVGPIAVFGLLQIVLWFACFLIVGVLMKASGYPDFMPLDRFYPSARFFRHWGLLFLLIPMIWTLWASWDWEANDSSPIREKDHLAIGIGLLGLTIFLVFVFATNAQPRMPPIPALGS